MTVAFRVPVNCKSGGYLVLRPISASPSTIMSRSWDAPEKNSLRLITSGWHGFGFLVVS